MLKFITLHTRERTPLFSGYFPDKKSCLEAAVEKGVSLGGIDLSYTMLVGANLDDADMPEADFTGANLCSANLSESTLTGSHFESTQLADCCFALSDLSGSLILECRTGATDISGCNLSNCFFRGPEIFRLDFIKACDMTGCRYEDCGGNIVTMDRAPIVITGLHKPVILMNNIIIKEGKALSYSK